MSHHSLAVNANTPSRDSVISTPAIFNEIRIGGDALSDNYANSPATAINNSTLYYYDTSPVNTIDGATITSSNNWVSSITLPIGTYLLEAAFSVVFSSSVSSLGLL